MKPRLACGAVALVAVLIPAVVGAQVFQVRKPSGDPLLVGSLAVGLFESNTIIDGTTQSEWDFGNGTAIQYRGSLEYALRNYNAIGVVATYSRAPFTYRARVAPPGAGQCDRCDADMDVVSVWGAFHGGGGDGLHYVVEGGLGYTWYMNMDRTDGEGGRLNPSVSDKDFSFFFGTGFGYQFNRRFAVNFVRDFAFSRHQGEGLSNDERTTAQQGTWRLGARAGFGTRRPGL